MTDVLSLSHGVLDCRYPIVGIANNNKSCIPKGRFPVSLTHLSIEQAGGEAKTISQKLSLFPANFRA
jgi:hypothetical protein